jgi:RNA polymerase sigma-70 factor (ECF subfamily)
VPPLDRPAIPLPDDVADRVRAGDAAAFELLFRSQYAALCVVAERYVREPALAEELVQDVFAELWARRARWEVRTSARAYLFAAVRHRALNLRRHAAVERDWEEDERAPEVRELHRPPVTPDEELEAGELRRRLDAALDSLPERCRLVMHLRWRERLAYVEIAEALGISVKGVEVQLARGLRALRERLRG